MKITLLTVGKTDKDWVKQGIDIYVSRLKHYIPFAINEIPELKNVSSLSKEQIKS
jgi:23S rRNA (pseudouridine1915-N3)-methyltransferase